MQRALVSLGLVASLCLPNDVLAGALPEIGDNSGAFTHSIPIPMPPGPAGATPELQLLYSSAGGNGNAGVGWSLPYSAIRLDQSWGVPSFWLDGADPCDPESFEGRLWLDGQELIPSRQDPLAPKRCTYRTRPDSFTLIVPVEGESCTSPEGPDVDLPTGYAVVRNDGSTWWYGATSCDSPYVDRAEDGTPTRWLLQHVQDRDGNLVTYWPERGTGPAGAIDDWWFRSYANNTQGCDGCLRAVTWTARAKDKTDYAFDAVITGNPGSGVSINGAQQPYWAQQAGLTSKNTSFLNDPAAHWPATQSHYYVARIDWEPRPDVRTSFMSGGASRLDRRIRQIAVFADTDAEHSPFGDVVFGSTQTSIRTFRLDYDQGSTGRSRLTRVWPISGQYAADADYSGVFGAGFPSTGFDSWTPGAFANSPLVPNPWEFVWSDSSTIDPRGETGSWLGEHEVEMEIPGADALPWMGANWREGGFPTITMMDLNGDSLPEIVQHDKELPRWVSVANNAMGLLNPYTDVPPYVAKKDEADVGDADDRFWVRWNQGDGFTELLPGPVDPFALMEVGDWFPRADCDGSPETPDSWYDCPDQAAYAIGEAPGQSIEDLLDDADICDFWWTGVHSMYESPEQPPMLQPPPLGLSVPQTAWCEYRSCAPFCELGTTVTAGVHALAGDGNAVLDLPDQIEYLPSVSSNPGGGFTGNELTLWRRYAVARSSSGEAASTVASPFGLDTVLGAGGSPIEPRTMVRYVDGYARPSFQARISDITTELIGQIDSEDVPEGGVEEGQLSFDEVSWGTVKDGLVHDTFDINGDGYPDRVLGGAGVVENNTGLSPIGYSAPDYALVNPDPETTKDHAITTQHMPWFVSLYDPERQEFGQIGIWELPIAHDWLMGGPDAFPDPSLSTDTPDRRLFYEDHYFNFLGVWESTTTYASSPVSSHVSMTPTASGPSVGVGASIGPVSIGGSVSAGGAGWSVGIGPVSFQANSMSIGPVSIDYGGGIQTGPGAAAGVILFIIQKALETFEIPFGSGISATADGFGAQVTAIGGDCISCKTQIRWKRQGLVDLNGDGLQDYVITSNDRWRLDELGLTDLDWVVILNEGDGFAEEPIQWRGAHTRYMEATVTDPYRDGNGVNVEPAHRRSHQVAGLQDMNGDGLPDFVYSGIQWWDQDVCEDAPIEALNGAAGPQWSWLRRQTSIDELKGSATLCVQLNTGAGFAEPVSWFGTDPVPAEVRELEDGYVPALSVNRTWMERSPSYNDGYGVGISGVRDWNGDGLPDFWKMKPTGWTKEERMPLVYLSDGTRFVTTPMTERQRYGRFELFHHSMDMVQATPPGLIATSFSTANPVMDVSRNHTKPGGSVVQSAFLDLDGDGTLDWAQSFEPDGDDGEVPHIRLYPLQDAVPDILEQLWEPGGGTQRMTYAPARDFMDLPYAPNLASLPDGRPLTDDLEDVYPASSQVLASTVVYDGLGNRGSDPIGVVYQYGDPDFVHADPALSAGQGLTHPSFRRRPLGFARVVAQPCPFTSTSADGCKETPEVTVIQEFGTDWQTASLPWEQRVLDSSGRLRSKASTHWDANGFTSNYDADPRPESVFSDFNWHFAPVLVQSEALDEWGSPVRNAVQTSYEIRNGLPICTGSDLDGDDWVDKVQWTTWDPVLLDDGKRDAALMEGVSMLPLGAQHVLDPPDCGERSEVQSNGYAVRRTTYGRHPSGRVASALTYDIASNEQLTESFDYLPNGMPYQTTDTAGAKWFTLYEPTTGTLPIGELAPPNHQAGVEFLTSREICGLTVTCGPAAWGQSAEETDAGGRTTFVGYDALGRPQHSGDDVHAEVSEMRYARPLRAVAVDEEPIGFGGGLPAYVAARSPVAPGVDVWTHTWTDGLGRTLLVTEDWEDEQGQIGQRLAGGAQRDHRGRVVETPWPCFVPGTGLSSQTDWLGYLPGAADLGLCLDVPPRDTLEYDDLSRVVERTRPDQARVETHFSNHNGAVFSSTKLYEPQGTSPLVWTATTSTPFSVWTSRYGADTWRHDTTTGPLPGGLVQDQSELHTEERFDALGRRTGVWRTGQGSENTTFAWDGFDRLMAFADPDQGSWELDYDPAGRPEARRLVDPVTGSTDVATEWQYDARGRVLTEWSYDSAASWLAAQPDSWWQWDYDVDPGSMAPGGAMTAAGGAIGRPSSALHYRQGACGGSGVDAEQSLTWRYDRRGRPVEEAFAMHSCAWQGSGAPGALVAQHEWTTGDEKARTWMPWTGEEVGWLYDSAGRPESVYDSSGKLAEASYEIQGRLARIDMNNGVQQEYLYAGGNQSTQALTDSLVWNASGAALFGREYGWDAAGNLKWWKDDAPAGGPGAEQWDCDYDGIGALLGCQNRSQPEWFEYSYDVLGNLISEDVEVDGASRFATQYARGAGGLTPMAGSTSPLNAPVARVVGHASASAAAPGQSFFYDGRGHMVGQRYHDPYASAAGTVTTAGLADANLQMLTPIWQRRFLWNAKGRLDSVRVQAAGVDQEVSRYWYGPGGNRIAERVTPLASEPDPTWVQSRRWAGIRTVEPELEDARFTLSITLGSTVVAQKTVEPNPLQPGQSTETMRYLGGDHLGSASIVTDAKGDLVRGVRYEPYGRIRDEWGPEAESEDYALAGVDDLFNGKPRTRKAFGLSGLMGGDYELEGYDYGARIYLPELSRWASADSITPDTVWEANAFAYVRNNPLKYRDPDGHFAETALDLLDVGYSTWLLVDEPSWENLGWLGVSIVGAALPFVPGAWAARIGKQATRGLKYAGRLQDLGAVEAKVAKQLLNRGDDIIGVGDDAVRKVLGKPDGKAIDFLSQTDGGKFRLTEVKGSFGTGGADVGSALLQLEQTAAALIRKLPDARLGRIEIALPKGAKLNDQAYKVIGDRLARVIDGQIEWAEVAGKAVHVLEIVD